MEDNNVGDDARHVTLCIKKALKKGLESGRFKTVRETGKGAGSFKLNRDHEENNPKKKVKEVKKPVEKESKTKVSKKPDASKTAATKKATTSKSEKTASATKKEGKTKNVKFSEEQDEPKGNKRRSLTKQNKTKASAKKQKLASLRRRLLLPRKEVKLKM